MKNSIVLLFLAAFLSVSLFAQTVRLNEGSNSIRVIFSDELETILQYNISHFETKPVQIDGNEWHTILLSKEGITQDKGYPQLPVFNRSIIISNTARMNLEVYDVQYYEMQLKVAPSKGIITRDINPDTVPYEFGDIYQSKDFYPAFMAGLSEPYILRDFRGITVKTIPFAYHPATGILRIYTSYKIRVYADGLDNVNLLLGSRNSISRAFAPIYENHFINWQSFRYTPVNDSFGKMLVVCHTDFMTTILPYVNWKKQKGIETELIQWSTIGTTATQLQTYIQNRYNADNAITYVQIVGDAPQIPSLSSGGGGADPIFSMVAGGDNYPDIFIGRFSAETTAQVTAQINKAIVYERDLSTSATWLSRAMGIASSEGGGSQGDMGESDIQHMDLIRTDLLNYGYTSVDQIYDPGASASTVTTNVNTGRGFINYVGHGSDTSWVTSGFNNTNATNLTNGNMTPFIMDVACVNGNFVSMTCFAEAWLRNANGGAVAMYASSINQSWNSPMRAQDETTDLLVAEQKFTTGGLYYNGSCKMMDIYGNTTGSDGVNMFRTWHIFGDASLLVRSKTPLAMTVNHPSVVLVGATTLNVSTGVANTLVALTHNNTIYARGYTDSSGNVTLTLVNPPLIPLTYTLTATAFNRVTYIGSVEQVPGSGPFVIVSTLNYADSNNNIPEYNETGRFNVTFQNIGTTSATNVTATLSSVTYGITITDNTEFIASLNAGASTTINNAYTFNIANNIANGTIADFTITMTSGANTWTHNFNLTLYAPTLTLGNMTISDPSPANNNGKLDPGETVTVTIPLNNTGGAASPEGSVTLISPTGGITINNSPQGFTSISAGGTASISFSVTASAGMSNGTLASLIFNAAAGVYTASKTETTEVGAPSEITIGSGTTSQTYPLDRYYNYSGHEAIYLASEIGMAGSIKSIGYYKASGTDVNPIEAVTIYMKHTSDATIATGNYSTTGYTQVYSGTFPNNAASGWMEVNLNQRFEYNGTSNLAILVIKGYQAWISYYPNWRYTTTTTRARQNHSDTAQPTSLTATTKLPHLKLTIFLQQTGPAISANPASVTASVYAGELVSPTVTISNPGTATLNWNTSASFASWGSVTPTSGTIPAGGNTVLNLTLNSNGLANGTYNSNLIIASDAINNPALSVPVSFTVQPSPYPDGPRFVAEWEPAKGAIVRYPLGLPYTMLANISANDLLYVIVTTANQSTANTNLSANGVNMANVRYINAATDSYWVRDYGPWYIFDADSNLKIVDFTYNRPRPNDNLIPSVVANYLGLDYYTMPINHTGGNIMTDGKGKAMSTNLVLTENSSLTPAQIDAMFQNYLGVSDYQLYPDPNNTYINHIDCWAKLLDADKVMIRSVPSGHAQYSAIEAVVAQWQSQTSAYGTPYRIYRVNTPNNEPYSNAFILNKKIYVPQMNTTNDAAALTAYQNAMPGYTVIGYSYSNFESTDAIHCRVNTVFDEQMIALKHTPPASIIANHSVVITAEISHFNPISTTASYVAWKHSVSDPWQYAALSFVRDGVYTASVPTPDMDGTLYYYIRAEDTLGKNSCLPLCSYNDPLTLAPEIEIILTTPDVVAFKTVSGIVLQWDAVQNANEYQIFRCLEPYGTYQQIGTTSNLQYTDFNDNDKAFYYIKAVMNARSRSHYRN